MKRGPKIKVTASGELYVSESQMQINFLRWFAVKHADLFDKIFSIPNGAKNGGRKNKNGVPVQAAIMKAEGLKKGVADLFLSVARSGFHGLYIESKTPVGTWDQDQKDFAAAVIPEGYAYILCRTPEQYEQQVTDYLEGKFIQTDVSLIDKNSKAYRSKARVAG